MFYGEYSEWKGMAQDTFVDATSSDKLKHWGIGIVQHVDAAAMEFWLAYKNYSLSGACDACDFNPEDLQSLTVGTGSALLIDA